MILFVCISVSLRFVFDIWEDIMMNKTERLILRSFRAEDFDDVYAYVKDPYLLKMIGWPEIDNEETGHMIFNNILEHGNYIALEHKKDGKVIGSIGFGKIENNRLLYDRVQIDDKLKNKKGCSLFFSLSAAYRRNGYMFEALTAVINKLIYEDNIDYINCSYFSFNDPSRQLQQKLGFHYYWTHTEGNDNLEVVENMLYKEDFAFN